MLDVLGVALDHAGEREDAFSVVRTDPGEGLLGQLAEHAAPLPSADLEERQGILERLFVGQEVS